MRKGVIPGKRLWHMAPYRELAPCNTIFEGVACFWDLEKVAIADAGRSVVHCLCPRRGCTLVPAFRASLAKQEARRWDSPSGRCRPSFANCSERATAHVLGGRRWRSRESGCVGCVRPAPQLEAALSRSLSDGRGDRESHLSKVGRASTSSSLNE